MAKFSILKKEDVNFVEVLMDEETVVTEAGALRYIRGDVDLLTKSDGNHNYYKAKFVGESKHKPIEKLNYYGTGVMVLEPSFHSFYELELNGEAYILDGGSFFAAEGTVVVEASVAEEVSSHFKGEKVFQLQVSGKGTVILKTQGAVEHIEMC
ncbi:AIM24 family protein, partial [bacterium]|nr:AIM24 family protein [bacterium]